LATKKIPHTTPAASILTVVTAVIQIITGPWTKENFLSWVKLISAILTISWALMQLFRIPSGSMEPTLHGVPNFFTGDRVAVNKLAYNFRIPFTTRSLIRLGEPKRWDIVVFKNPEKGAIHPTLIKRIVGLPGERIHVADGSIWVNGERMEPPAKLKDVLHYTTDLVPQREALIDQMLVSAKESVTLSINSGADPNLRVLIDDLVRLRPVVKDMDISKLPSKHKEQLVADVHESSFEFIRGQLVERWRESGLFKYGILEDDEHSLIPPDHYLMMGDNSGSSLDGRFFGWAPHNNLYGRAFAIVLPPMRIRDLTGFSRTWWGIALLIGIPAGLIGSDVYRRRKAKAAEASKPKAA
jgi:signal peptidase I